MVERLALDHQHAKTLADGISRIKGLQCDPEFVPTNIVYFTLERDDINGVELVSLMKKKGIQFFEISPKRFRLVTHCGIDASGIDETLAMFSQVMNGLS